VRRQQPNLVKLRRWLDGQPSLEEMQSRYPDDWRATEEQLGQAIQDKDHGRLDALLRPVARGPEGGQAERAKNLQELAQTLIRQRMAAVAIERFVTNSLTTGGKRHFGPLDRLIIRTLFFSKGYGRKLVSNTLFRLLWPLVRNRNLLLPLAETHGIYCFYSRRLIPGLYDLIAQRSCIEIAAGDGALTRYLNAAGANVAAFDDHSWAHKITYLPEVGKCDAAEALRLHKPKVVICSWPPAKNSFEQAVFQTASVERYIVIGSGLRFAFGNWSVYRAQKRFTLRRDAALSALLLPPEFGGAVYVFDRKGLPDRYEGTTASLPATKL
jgi:hypothetical protein